MSGSETRLRASVAGAAGYVGGEVIRLLAMHPAIREVRAHSESHAGQRLDSVHPPMRHLAPDAVFLSGGAVEAARDCDVVFLALPHGRSQDRMDAVLERDPGLVIDLSADFRIGDPALYAEHYGEHRAAHLLEGFVYGLADDLGADLRGRRRIAAPGCFATATLLALRPLARVGLIEGVSVCFAVTGSSGSGAHPKPSTHHPVRAHNYFGYAPAGHRHQAEIDDQIRRWGGPSDAPCRLVVHSAPLVRGIHATLHARLVRPMDDLPGVLRRSWRTSRFVHVVDRPPELAAVVGTNHAQVFGTTRGDGCEALVYVAIDNLVKGAAGQAVQAMNLALGLDEAAGLDFPGFYPC